MSYYLNDYYIHCSTFVCFHIIYYLYVMFILTLVLKHACVMRLKLALKTNLLRAIGIGYSQNLQNKYLIHHLVCPQRIITKLTRWARLDQMSQTDQMSHSTTQL